MAWYNPKQVSFDTDSGIISASGAVGKALWDIYKENTRYNQAQAELDEKIRANNANLEQKRAEFDYNKALQDKQYNLSVDKFNADLAYKNANLNQQRDYQNKNLALQRARLNSSNNNANLDNPLEVELKFQALNGQLPQDYANLNPNEQLEYKKAFVNTYTNPQISKFVSAQNQTPAQKNAIAKTQNVRGLLLNELKALDALIATANQIGGISKLGGVWDSIAYQFPNFSPDSNAYREALNNYAVVFQNSQKGQGKFNYENVREKLGTSIGGMDHAAQFMINRRKQLLNELYNNAQIAQTQGYKGVDEWLNDISALSLDDERVKNIIYGKEKINQPNLEKQTDRKSKWEAKTNANLEQNKTINQANPAPKYPQSAQNQVLDYLDLDELGVLYEPF